MTVERITTRTPGDYVVIDANHGRVYALLRDLASEAVALLRRVAAGVDPDPQVFINDKPPGRRDQLDVHATVITSLQSNADGRDLVARTSDPDDQLILAPGEVAALMRALRMR